ncbi:MAG: hypothetical protein U1F21_06355 [Sphaerotilus natans]
MKRQRKARARLSRRLNFNAFFKFHKNFLSRLTPKFTGGHAKRMGVRVCVLAQTEPAARKGTVRRCAATFVCNGTLAWLSGACTKCRMLDVSADHIHLFALIPAKRFCLLGDFRVNSSRRAKPYLKARLGDKEPIFAGLHDSG